MKNKKIAAISPNLKPGAPKHAEVEAASTPSLRDPLPLLEPAKHAEEVGGPIIFKQNVKNNSKLRPFNEIISDVGNIQYFPA